MCADKVDADVIEKKVIEIISDQIGLDESELTREVSFITDLSVDSLDIVELIMQFEGEFGVCIQERRQMESRPSAMGRAMLSIL